ncbi:hypothetical protein RB195_022951 [Necator americanus]|uniref:Uncharacterized protein n=1 Tax=Necator americanus TaxID=51031 RepID=A0ABR1EH81_NECAM
MVETLVKNMQSMNITPLISFIRAVKVRRPRTDREEATPPTERRYDTGEELFLLICDSRGVGGVGVVVRASMAKNMDEQLTTRIGRLRMRRCDATLALTIFVA